MTTGRDHLTKADTVTIAAIERSIPTLVEARSLLDRFHAMVRRKGIDLDGWIADATTSLMASFASGISRDKLAVAAASSPWSNGQTEGQITELKMVKRQMMVGPRSTCWKPGSSAQHDSYRAVIEIARPPFGRLYPRKQGPYSTPINR